LTGHGSWRTLRARLEREGRVGPSLTLYGLRHTVAVILRECGADERTIADALGQKTIEMARHYAQGADLRRKMRGVVTELDAEVNRRRHKGCQTNLKKCQTSTHTKKETGEMSDKFKQLDGSGGALPPFPTPAKHPL
jgi:hypothetical protein